MSQSTTTVRLTPTSSMACVRGLPLMSSGVCADYGHTHAKLEIP
jgi:hypothetical protein